MNCSNCNTPLNEGSDICPNCGALNMSFNKQFAPQMSSSESPAIPIDENELSINESSNTNQNNNQFINDEIILEDGPIEEQITNNVLIEGTNPVIGDYIQDKNTIETDTIQNGNNEENTFSNTEEDTIDLIDDTPEEVISENTLPPSLEVQNENMLEGIQDISQANVSTYEVEPSSVDENINNEESKEEQFDIAIPQIKEPVNNVDIPLDGSAPSIDTNKTVGTQTKEEDLEENIEIKHKKIIRFPKFSGNTPKPVLLVGIVGVLGLGILIGAVLFSKNVCTAAPIKKTTNVSKNVVADGNNNITKAGAYTYKIPKDYKYDKKDNGILIYDDKSTWRIYLRADAGLYDDVASAKSSVKASLESTGINVNNIKETKIKDRLYMLIEGLTKTTSRLIAFTDAGNDYIFYMEIVTVDNIYNYDLLEIANDILVNATFNEEVSKIETISVYDVANIAILAAQEYKSRVDNK